MTKRSLDYILEKYLNDTCTDSEKKEVEQWLDLVGSDTDLVKDEQTWNQLKHEIWSVVSKKPSSINFTNQKNWFKVASIAAIILLVLSYTFKNSFITDPTIAVLPTADLITKLNETHKYLKIDLPDGSQVSLAPEASVSFPAHFENNNRKVVLKGKAFFEIKKNANSPFLVYSKNIITKVLGTSFWIEPANLSDNVTVEVVTGKVSVYENLENKSTKAAKHINNGVIITPNQKVFFIEEKNVFITGLVDKPKPIDVIKNTPERPTIKNNEFIFYDTEITQVLNVYQKKYGINIEVETQKLRNCTLTADLTGLDFYTSIQIICQSINANYEIKGTSILIYGRGCI